MGKKTKAKKIKPPKRKDTPADWQEQHSPTVEFTARGDVRHDPSGKPKREVIGIARRRKDDAELVMGLDPAQIQARLLRNCAPPTWSSWVLSPSGVPANEQRIDRQRGTPTATSRTSTAPRTMRPGSRRVARPSRGWTSMRCTK
jgi:hypothetical protein